MSLRRGSHRRITVKCESRVAKDCKGQWDIEERLANETRAKNDGRIICSRCSIATKRSGRTNPNTRYRLDDSFFAAVDTEAKAYLLGWIASDGSITKGSINITIHNKDRQTLTILRDVICPQLPIRPKKNTPLVGFTISSQQVVADVCTWLRIEPGKKSRTVGFAALDTEVLRWAFLRGMFDGDGSISSVDAALNRNPWPSPRCSLACRSETFLDEVQKFTNVPCYRHGDGLEWSGANALDILGKLYKNASYRLTRKYDLYLDWCCWMPALNGPKQRGSHPLFKWARTSAQAVAPSKNATSDSGFDLTLIERAKVHGSVEFYRTGIKVQPAFGWYFDLVPRSSISKTGYMLANGVGVIDRAYTGEILVPLTKIDPNAPDLPLPSRLVQIIPRQIIAAEFVEVDVLDETARGDGGFGSTG